MEGKHLVFLCTLRRTEVKSDDLGYFYSTVQRRDNSSCKHIQCNIKAVFSNSSLSHASRSIVFIKTCKTHPNVLSTTDLSSCTDTPASYFNSALEVYTHAAKSPLNCTIDIAVVLFSRRAGHVKLLMPRKQNSVAGPLWLHTVTMPRVKCLPDTKA